MITAKMTGIKENPFNLMTIAINALREANLTEEILEMRSRTGQAKTCDEIIKIIYEYVDIK